MAKKPKGRDYPLSQTPEPKKEGGTYFAFPNGRLSRTTPIHESAFEVQAIDTTGYAKGKKNFELKTEGSVNSGSKTISRKDVPTVVERLKQGATRREDYRTSSQKSKK
jgi:hypothetical protein